MKIIGTDNNYPTNSRRNQPIFFLKPETSMIRAGLPFFYPDFSAEIHCGITLVFKICKVGRHIQPKFAHTYYKEVGIALDFTALDVLKTSIRHGLPWETSRAFDGSVAISHFLPLGQFPEKDNIPFSLSKNGKTICVIQSADMLYPVDQLIARISTHFTLKTGDMVFTGTPPEDLQPVRVGDKLMASLLGERIMELDIK